MYANTLQISTLALIIHLISRYGVYCTWKLFFKNRVYGVPMVGNAQIIANHMDNSSQEPTTGKWICTLPPFNHWWFFKLTIHVFLFKAETDSGEATESTPLLPEQRSAFGTIVLTLLCILFAVGLVCGIYLILKEGK